MNHDGYIDVVINTSSQEKILINRGVAGPGIFDLSQTYFANLGDPNGGNGTGLQFGNNTEGVGILDYDGDGDLDIMFENHNWGIDLMENRNFGDGVFQQVTLNGNSPPAPYTGVNSLPNTYSEGDYSSVTDYDDDGWVDLVCRKDWPGNAQADFFRNNGMVGGVPTFSSGVNINGAPNSNKGAVALYDLDNDGDFDLIWTDGPDYATRIYQNNNGTFTPTLEPWVSSFTIPPSNSIDGLACGDVDNDGDIDIFFGTNSGAGYLFLNRASNGGGMTFTRSNGNINLNADGEGCVFVDFDRDGDLDLYSNINGAANQLWVNTKNTTASFPSERSDAYLMVRVWETRGNTGIVGAHPQRPALGATIVLKDCSGNILSGIREVNGGNGHGTQDPSLVHFGLEYGPDVPYIVEVKYPRYKDAAGVYQRTIVQYAVKPSTISGYKVIDIYPNTQLPLYSVTADQPVYCVGNNVRLSADVLFATNPIRYAWSGPLGFTSNIRRPSFTATASNAGIYTVTITDRSGCSGTATEFIVINTPPTVSLSPPVTVCTGGDGIISSVVSAGTGPFQYQWQRSNNNASWTNIAGATNTTYQTPALSTTTYYRLVVTPIGTGCVAVSSSSVDIQVVPDPVITITSPFSNICVGGTVVFNATTSGGTGTCNLQWQKRDSPTSPWVNIIGATGNSYTATNITNQAEYQAIYTCSGSGCCE